MARRFIWLSTAIVAVIGLYTFGWFYAADRLVTEANAAFDRLSRNGNRVACENAEAVGYPFRIGLFCNSVFFERRTEGFTADTGAFRSAAQIYAPMRIIAEIDAPARLNLPWFHPLHFKWESMRASARLATPLPELLSIVAGQIAVEADTPGAGNTGLLGADEVQLHLRPRGADLEIGLRMTAISPGPLLADVGLPAFSGAGDIKLADGALRVEHRDFNLPGSSFDIRSLDLMIEGGGTLAVSGPLSIREDGLIDADLQVKSSDAAALLAILAEAFPEIRTQMLTLGAGLAALGPDQALPLRIRAGTATLGFIELGRIPAI
ncbi:MAG: DUF2125 domain-containing protein [Rhizobiaceae bacterium]